MDFFSKNEPIIFKESNSAKEQLAVLESFRGKLPAHDEKQLEADIRFVKYGIDGEKNVLFELSNSRMDMYVLQDIHLEYEGQTAQIDFLVLTRQRYFIIECKNLYGNIEINERGDFIRTYRGRKREGIYSPLTQNQRHINLIRSLRKATRGKVLGLIADRSFEDQYRSLIVLANPKTVIDDRRAPEEVKKLIVRADQLVSTIKAINNEWGIGRSKLAMTDVEDVANWFMEMDKGPGRVDYAAKYREKTSVVANGGASDAPFEADSSDASALYQMSGGGNSGHNLVGRAEGPVDSAHTAEVPCPRCGAPMVLRKAKRGDFAGQQFYGCSNYPKCRGIVNIDGA